jgi:trehalose 6-phosphate phosphatase
VTDAVAALLADPLSAMVALDFDGTLAPIVEHPDQARLAAGARDVLHSLAERIGQLAVISGRPAEEVVALSGLSDVSGLRVLGHYGLQRWHDGRLDSPPPDPGVERARLRLPALLESAPEGVYVEDKDHSVAVHTRPASDPQAALDELAPALRRLASDMGLEAAPGRYVLELRPAGMDKGAALRGLIDDVGASTVIYIGDDVGDLPAFRAVTNLRDTGKIAGLAVVAYKEPSSTDGPASAGRRGSGEVPAALRDAADLVLPGPDAVVGWLAGLLAML